MGDVVLTRRDGDTSESGNDRAWVLLGAVASVLIVVALVAGQVTFTSDVTARTDTGAFLDEASAERSRFVASVVLFTALAFLVVPVFLSLRRVLGDDRRMALDTAVAFAVLGAAFSASADATQLAVGGGLLPTWQDADPAGQALVLSDAHAQLWLGDVLTDLSRLAFGLAVLAAASRMVVSRERGWRIGGAVGLVAGVGSVIGAFALLVEPLEVVWVLGLLALLLWFLTVSVGLWNARTRG